MVNVAEEVVFTINFRKGITNEMLIDFGGKLFEIVRIDDYEGYKDDLNIYCKLAADQNIEIAEPEEQA